MHNLTHKLKHYLDGSRQLEDTFKYSTVLYAVAFIHLIITIVFLHYNIFPMYLYNILIFGVYLYMAGVYIKKKAYRAIYLFSISEILFHSVYATLLVGWEWGFMIYTIALVSVSFYMAFTLSQFRRKFLTPFISGIIILLCFIGTKLICVRHLPYYRDFAPSGAVGIYYCFNSFVCFVMLILFSFFFVLEIRHTQLHLEQEKETLDAIASHDPLTQLLNRRSMEIHLHKAMEQAKKIGTQFCVILGDIDDFKKVNDTYGHECGDKILILVADTIRSHIRPEDCICRWGGEEILLLINGTETVATALAEKIRASIEQACVTEEGTEVSVTMTFGVASYIPGFKINKLIQLADNNLYIGKNNGKNQVVS